MENTSYPEPDYDYREAEKSIVGDTGRPPLIEQEKALAELHDTITILGKRLNQVLRPALEHADDRLTTEPSAERVPMSPLANTVANRTQGIREATRKLHELMNRLDV